MCRSLPSEHQIHSQRVHYLEDELIGLKKDSQLKIEKLESLLRHREMLTRNAEEHALRLEERDAQLQTELNAAQDRYNELLRAHVDLLERNKLAGSDCGSQRTTVFEHLDVTKSSVKSLANDQNYPLDGTKVSDPNMYDTGRPNDDEYLMTEPSVLLAPMRSTDRVSSFINLLDESMDCESVVAPSTTTDAEDDDEAVRMSEAADCTENSYGMMREVEKLISENMELSATKNALNVVKNDLIRKLDDVTGEKLLLTRELESIRLSRDQTRNEANRLVRQVHDCQNKISHLVARLKLYEDVDEIALNNLRQSSAYLPHATSCLVLNTDSVSSLVVPSAPLTNLKTMSKLSGSVNCMNVKKDRRVAASMMNLTTTHPVLVTEGSSGVACPSSDTTQLDEAMRNAKLGEPCFTKREMARVIAERNHYKESFIELQEALRHMESLRAERFGEDGRSGSRLRTHSNSPINSRNNRPISLAQQILVAIQNAAGDFANGVSDFFSDMEPLFVPSVPSEAQQHYMNFPSDWSAQSTSTDLPGGAHSSELRRMFSHLIGHAAGHGTEAFLGTGNDFAATVNSQSLTNTTQRLLDRHYASQVSASPDHLSAVPGSSHHPRNRTPSNVLSSLPTSATNVCTRPMASVGSPTVGRGQGANSHRGTSTNPTKLSNSSRENVLDEALVIQ
ncbi:C-Jun-amino-terminal kinase-interacting protein 4 [Fasciola gigantica]|uniref:C-Jun-amino-terminal kinase-interacting protein 4 n=1 Tax=Fasciola gigantica TaxID=46835 RepID=A0A504YJ24_FASGI|nr:C-Jun-amino-terminal kinase-interacting protein 4 [Fasciola gigantica]